MNGMLSESLEVSLDEWEIRHRAESVHDMHSTWMSGLRLSSRTAFRTHRGRRLEVVYPARVSDKPPQTYILHTVVLFIVLVTAMVLFLRYQWG